MSLVILVNNVPISGTSLNMGGNVLYIRSYTINQNELYRNLFEH
jgi:hypothetical protein